MNLRTKKRRCMWGRRLIVVDRGLGCLSDLGCETQEMEAVARSAEFPAISAMVASDGNMACSDAPAGKGTAAKAPSPAADGPTFFRCGHCRLAALLERCSAPEALLLRFTSFWLDKQTSMTTIAENKTLNKLSNSFLQRSPFAQGVRVC